MESSNIKTRISKLAIIFIIVASVICFFVLNVTVLFKENSKAAEENLSNMLNQLIDVVEDLSVPRDYSVTGQNPDSSFDPERMKIVFERLPVNNGVEYFVSEKTSGKIISSTEDNHIGKKLEEVGIIKPELTLDEQKFFMTKIDGVKTFCVLTDHGEFYIGTAQNSIMMDRNVSITILITVIYITILIISIFAFLNYLNKKNRLEKDSRIKRQERVLENLRNQLAVIQGISSDTTDIAIVDEETMQSSLLKINGKMKEYEEVLGDEGIPYSKCWDGYINKFVYPEDSETLRMMIRPETVKKVLSEKPAYSVTYRVVYQENIYNYQVTFTRIENEEQDTKLLIAAFRNIDNLLEARKKMSLLEEAAEKDKLTGFYNRRAYEDYAVKTPGIPAEENFVLVAMDVNGLKQTNDNLGHDAGDELLRGAAKCIKQCFGPYGKIYRTGGDEFVALIFASEETIKDIQKDFAEQTGAWRGKNVDTLSVSCGFAEHSENPNMNFKELSKLADRKMYEAKTAFYASKGVDRRGQQAAYDALCESYTKILKVNLTDDSYTIIRMENSEKDSAKGFSDSISLWLKAFALTGQVAIENREEFLQKADLNYLQNYFREGNTTFCIYYNRLCNGEFKKVMMEIIPAKEYTPENQYVFLYIKKIEN